MERILKKRFLMILMSLMLVAGFVPMTASAEPETGDDFNAVPMVTLMALAAAVAAGTVAYGVRRKKGVR